MPPFRRPSAIKPREGLTQKQRTAVTKIVRRSHKNMAEPKRYVKANLEATALAQNGYIINPLAGIVQGTTMQTRVANTIHLDSLEINATICNDEILQGIEFTMYVFWSDMEISSSSGFATITNATFAATLPLLGSVSNKQICNNFLDVTQATQIYMTHQSIPCTAAGAGAANYRTINKKINFRGKKLQYQGDASSFCNGQNLYILFVTDAYTSVPNTTNLGYLSATYQLKYHE